MKPDPATFVFITVGHLPADMPPEQVGSLLPLFCQSVSLSGLARGNMLAASSMPPQELLQLLQATIPLPTPLPKISLQ